MPLGRSKQVSELPARITLSSNYSMSMLEAIHVDWKQDFIQSQKNDM